MNKLAPSTMQVATEKSKKTKKANRSFMFASDMVLQLNLNCKLLSMRY